MTRWFRLYDEVLDDPKVQMLSPEMFKTWVNILALASRKDGKLPAVAAMAFALRISPNDMQARVDDLILTGLIDILPDRSLEPHNWGKRQWKSDDSKERVRRHRAAKRADVTPVTVTVTPPDTDTDTETEKEKEGVGERERETLKVTDTEIKHRAFVVSLPAIEMATIRSGLPKTEIKTHCHAHALQWAAEIDGGKLPRDVLPQKIANFLAASVMSEVSRDQRTLSRGTARPLNDRQRLNAKATSILRQMHAEAIAEEGTIQ